MHEPNDNWQRLARAARHAPAPAPPELPHGFATRVVARWQAGETFAAPSAWEWLSLRALGWVAAVMVASLCLNLDVFGQDWTQPFTMADNVVASLFQP